MITLYTHEEFENAKVLDTLPLECNGCHLPFLVSKRRIQSFIKNCAGDKFCSRRCHGLSRTRQIVKHRFRCVQCNKELIRNDSQVKALTKKGAKNYFCSNFCKGTHSAQNRKTGTNRSKLEIWLELQLRQYYPNLNILFNETSAIKAELDIYIPSLQLAFELNGPFHYEPIFGPDKLAKTQSNDQRKFLACAESGIDLCVIDTHNARYFKPKSSQQFLDIIVKLITDKSVDPAGYAPATSTLRG